jgi:hypothetical protein
MFTWTSPKSFSPIHLRAFTKASLHFFAESINFFRSIATDTITDDPSIKLFTPQASL